MAFLDAFCKSIWCHRGASNLLLAQAGACDLDVTVRWHVSIFLCLLPTIWVTSCQIPGPSAARINSDAVEQQSGVLWTGGQHSRVLWRWFPVLDRVSVGWIRLLYRLNLDHRLWVANFMFCAHHHSTMSLSSSVNFLRLGIHIK